MTTKLQEQLSAKLINGADKKRSCSLQNILPGHSVKFFKLRISKIWTKHKSIVCPALAQ